MEKALKRKFQRRLRQLLLPVKELLLGEPEEETVSLVGDRAIEWSWVSSHLPVHNSCVLDFGGVQSPLTLLAARMGHKVSCVDLREIEYVFPGVTFCRGNIMNLELPTRHFDFIMNCSTIEHVGLGGRFGEEELLDGDLIAMERLKSFQKKEGTMAVTIPVGLDAVIAPFHRIYGSDRLPKLFHGFEIVEEEFWAKTDGQKWQLTTRAEALTMRGRADLYALGLFILKVV